MSQIIQIPLDNGAPMPFFDMQAVLDGVTYTLRIRWNVVDAHWYLRLLDESAQTVLRGDWKLVADWPAWSYRASALPAGSIVPVDSSGEGRDPEVSDFGIRVKLVYLTAAELGR